MEQSFANPGGKKADHKEVTKRGMTWTEAIKSEKGGFREKNTENAYSAREGTLPRWPFAKKRRSATTDEKDHQRGVGEQCIPGSPNSLPRRGERLCPTQSTAGGYGQRGVEM